MNEGNIEEGYGEETDDWMMEDTRKEFISFDKSPGAVVVVMTGKPSKHVNKFGKDQFWFPCYQLMGEHTENYSLDEKILSTSSHQLRKKFTKMHQKAPDASSGFFSGRMPVVITWEGDGMARYYTVSWADDAIEDVVSKLLSKL